MGGEDDTVPRLREVCLRLPEVFERPSHRGEPSWMIGGRKLVQFSERHPAGRRSFWVPGPVGARQAMITAEPDRFFAPPYGGPTWVGVYVDVPVDWGEARELIIDAYRLIAPKRLAARLGDC